MEQSEIKSIRRVLLGNGVRLCPQSPLPDDRDGFLERAVRDVAAPVGGTPRRRVTRDGRSVKPPGKHACCEVWEVELPEGVAVVSLADWNKGHKVTVPYVWPKFCAVFLVLCLCKQQKCTHECTMSNVWAPRLAYPGIGGGGQGGGQEAKGGKPKAQGGEPKAAGGEPVDARGVVQTVG